MPGKLTPGSGGRTGAVAGGENQLVVAFFVLAAGNEFAARTFLAARSMASTEVSVRTSKLKRSCKRCAVVTSSFSRCEIVPPR